MLIQAFLTHLLWANITLKQLLWDVFPALVAPQMLSVNAYQSTRLNLARQTLDFVLVLQHQMVLELGPCFISGFAEVALIEDIEMRRVDVSVEHGLDLF